MLFNELNLFCDDIDIVDFDNLHVDYDVREVFNVILHMHKLFEQV